MTFKSLLAAALVLAPAFLHADSRMLRHPSYSKGKVAFSYLGDIWVANEDGTGVTRITDKRRARNLPALFARRLPNRVLIEQGRELRRLRRLRNRWHAAPAYL